MRPTHTVVRRRVVDHCVAKLRKFQRHADFSAGALDALRAIWASYFGHFRHASHHRLCRRLHVRFPWLGNALRPEDHP
jgi:hypothetical protein